MLVSFLSISASLAKSPMFISFLEDKTLRILRSGSPPSAYSLPLSVNEIISSTSLSTSIISLEAREPAALITDLISICVFLAISSGVASGLVSNSFKSFFS